jgi:hypothetical protein
MNIIVGTIHYMGLIQIKESKTLTQLIHCLKNQKVKKLLKTGGFQIC